MSAIFSANTFEQAEAYTPKIEQLGTHMLMLGDSVINDGLLSGKWLTQVQGVMEKTMTLLSQTQPINEQNM